MWRAAEIINAADCHTFEIYSGLNLNRYGVA
ncbi:hypothetical protein M785_02475, partial [Neisseria gonorrhoeae MU_NG20]